MFDVYVVGATEPGDDGIDKLAEAMSARYGLPLEDLRGRLARGRFRVKAGVDRATGDSYAKDLVLIGARVSIEDATSAPGQSIPPPIAVPAARAGGTTTPPAGAYQSGLSAAFSGSSIPAADLGALGREDTFALASLDGHDGHAGAKMPPSEVYTPPLAAAAARGGAAAAKPPRPRDVPVELDDPYAPGGALDPFRPPDADDDDRPVEIAADEIEHRARKRMSTPPASTPVVAPLPVTPVQTLQPRAATAPAKPVAVAVAIVRPPGRLGPLGDDRVRLAAGVLLAVLLGFVPAHVVASIRERAADHAIDSAVVQHQLDATSADDYAALDAFRARELDDKRSAHHSIELMAFAIWAVAGGAIAFGWFKQVPWDRLDEPRTA